LYRVSFVSVCFLVVFRTTFHWKFSPSCAIKEPGTMAKTPSSDGGKGAEAAVDAAATTPAADVATNVAMPEGGAATAAPKRETVPAVSTGNLPAPSSQGPSRPLRTFEGTAGLETDPDEIARQMAEINAAMGENIGQGEIKVSRMAIAQPGTPQVAANEPGWKGGMLFSNLTKEIFSVAGKAPWLLSKGISPTEVRTYDYANFVPIFRLPSEYCKWPTQEERDAGIKQYHWKTLNLNDPRVQEGLWRPKGIWQGTGAPPVTEHLNILGYCLNDDGTPRSGLVVASFSRTSFPTGELIVTNCREQLMQGLAFWGRVYHLYTEPTKNKKNQTYYVMQFAKGKKLLEFGTEENRDAVKSIFTQCYLTAKELSDKLNGKALQELYINASGLGEDEEAGAAVTGGEGEEGGMDPNF